MAIAAGESDDGARGLTSMTPPSVEPRRTAVPLDEERDALVVLAGADGVGPATLERLLEVFGSAVAVLAAASARDGASALGAAVRRAGHGGPDSGRAAIPSRTLAALADAARRPDVALESLREAGVHALIHGDPGYPARLRTIDLPPRVLFVRGSEVALRADAAVAVVGTRRPTDAGRRIAGRIGAALARAGAVVVSGLALGIDGAAHAAVVEEGGLTVAVIGGGHARLAPLAHDRLATAIVESGGAVVSEHAPGVEPSRGTFPRRNRIISGLADAVVVVEAGARSGALLTAAWALEQGRECFFVPGSIEAPESAGCLAWLRDYGGIARIVAGVPQLLDDLGLAGAAAFHPVDEPADRSGSDRSGSGRPPPGLRPSERRTSAPSLDAVAADLPAREALILRALAAGASTADEVAAVTSQPIGTILGGLTALEERGIVEARRGRYRNADGGPMGVRGG